MGRPRSWILDQYKIIYDKAHDRVGKAYCLHCPVLDVSSPFITSKCYVYPASSYGHYIDHVAKHHTDVFDRVKPVQSIARSGSSSTASSSSLLTVSLKRSNENGEMPVKKRQTVRSVQTRLDQLPATDDEIADTYAEAMCELTIPRDWLRNASFIKLLNLHCRFPAGKPTPTVIDASAFI